MIFQIAGIRIELIIEKDIRLSEPFMPFLCEEDDKSVGNSIWKIYCRRVTELPQISGKMVFDSIDFSAYEKAAGIFTRYYKDRKNDGFIYAVSEIEPEKKLVKVSYLAEGEAFLGAVHSCFYHGHWEQILAYEYRMILHGSCIDSEYGGIIFSGPSGIGKSTQSDLWEKYEGATLVNGDRPILFRDEDGWKAFGSPYAGSSKCHKNISIDVTSIVMLEQSKECKIRKLLPGEVLRKIYSGVTINIWNECFVDSILEMISGLIDEVPVFELSCRPDREAVETLKNELRRFSDE